MGSSIAELPIFRYKPMFAQWITVKMFLTIRYCMSLKLEEQEMYMRLTPREKEMADMFEQMSKDEQEIMIEFAK